MLTPIALLPRPSQASAVAPGAESTSVYEKPVVPIRELAADLGITMSFLHRKARAGTLGSFPVGDQTCVTAETAQRIRAWWNSKRPNERWPDFSKPEEPDGEQSLPRSGT
jgi:hypothetical protein